MNIPEEILKKTDKELKQILVDNPKTAIYFLQSNNVYKVIAKIKGKIVLNELGKSSTYTVSMSELMDKSSIFKSFTFNKYKETITANRFVNLGKLPIDKFVKYLTTVISYTKEEQFFDIIVKDKDKIDLVVYYPEITITNSVEISHTIRDIYVKYEFFKATTWILDDVSIGRTTFTKKELQSNYIFSHCSGGCATGYTSTLCYGESTPIKKLRSKLTISLYNLSYFFALFDQYLQWESLEGTPYAFIEKINNCRDSFDPIECVFTTEETDELIVKILPFILEFTYSYTFDGDSQIIELNDESINRIDDLLTLQVDDVHKFVRYNDQSGDYRVDYSIEELEGTTTDIVWRGEAVPIHIIKEPASKTNKKVHVQILDTVVSRLTKAFEEFLITEEI